MPLTSTAKVSQYLKNLDVRKSTGTDEIGPRLLKLSSPFIAESLTFICNLRLIVPLVSFGTPWPNKQNHKTLHFQNFLTEKFNAASIKITVFKIKSHFTEYSSVILNLSIILTEICIFSKIFKQMQILQKQKEICIFSARLLRSVKC